MISDQLLKAALQYASIGLSPVPMMGQTKSPALKGWRDTASRDPNLIAAVFKAAPHADAIGLATGEAIFAIDLDRNHADGHDGITTFDRLAERLSGGEPLAVGPSVLTPAGGLHLYFASPVGSRIRNKAGIAAGIDVRGDGGLAMVPPSVRNGIAYRWKLDPWIHPIVMAPSWLLNLVAPASPPPRPITALKPFSGDMTAYARAALEREWAAVAGCVKGSRNHTLYKAAAALGQLAAGGMLAVETVVAALLDAAAACGLIAEDGRAAVEATIASGLKQGLSSPRAAPERRR